MAHGPKRICYTLRSIVVQYGEEVVSSLSVISYRHRGSLLRISRNSHRLSGTPTTWLGPAPFRHPVI